MKEMTFEIGGKTIRRVSRRTARRLFEEGKAIYVYTCLANPHSPWNQPSIWTKGANALSFTAHDNAFSYYNCNNEMGRYPAYYVEV